MAAFYPGQVTAASEYLADVEAGLGRFEKAFPNHKTIELADGDRFFFEDYAPRMVTEIGAFVGGKVIS